MKNICSPRPPTIALVKLVFVTLTVLMVTSCVSSNNNRPASANLATNFGGIECPVVPPQGLLFSKFSAPLDFDADYKDPDLPPLSQMRKGESQDVIFIHLWPIIYPTSVSVGKTTIDEAGKDGNLSKIYYADYEYMQVLGVFAMMKVIVYGE